MRQGDSLGFSMTITEPELRRDSMWTWRLLLVFVTTSLAFSGCFRRPCGSSTTLRGTTPFLDAHFSVPECCVGRSYVWNGTACTEVPALALCGCSCSGRDCDKVFSSLESCERAYRHCG